MSHNRTALGTPRIEVDATGSLSSVRRHDYLPFGEELTVGMGNGSIRSAGQGYTADCVRQRFGSYERDDETGLDFAEARYCSSVQGRFTSVDPIYFQAEMVADPQRFNLYGYARNNPLKFIDPTGETIRLSDDEKEREKELRNLRDAVGSEAGAYLYANKVEIKDKDGNVTGSEYHVGIYTNGPDGKGPAFDQINDAAGELAPIIADKKVVDFRVVSKAGTPFEFDGATVKIGSADNKQSPGRTGYVNGQLTLVVLDSLLYPGQIPPTLMEGGDFGDVYPGELAGHELGHARDIMTGRDPYLNGLDAGSIRIENKVRKLHNPSAPRRLKER